MTSKIILSPNLMINKIRNVKSTSALTSPDLYRIPILSQYTLPTFKSSLLRKSSINPHQGNIQKINSSLRGRSKGNKKRITVINKKEWKWSNKFIAHFLFLSPYWYGILNKDGTSDEQSLDVGYYLLQSRYFLQYLNLYPHLLDLVLDGLINPSIMKIQQSQSQSQSQEELLITYLTLFWIGYFDLMHQISDYSDKWKGITIKLSGRIGFRKMGRAKKYTRYWGTIRSSQARYPLQSTFSQIPTRYGIIGMKIFLH